MADFEVGARLELRNLTAFAGGMRRAAEAVDNVGERARRSSLSLKAMGAASRGASRVGGAAMTGLKYGALGAVAGMAAVGAASVKAAAEAEQVSAQTDAVIKSTGGVAQVSAQHVEDQAQQLMKLSGVSDEAIASGQNLLLTFKGVRNEGGRAGGTFDQATKAALDMSVAMGTDMRSASMMVGKALNDPVQGLSKLTRSGVTFTEAQKEQITAMSEAGNTAGAQAIMLQELQEEFGGSAKAAGKTAAGGFAIFREMVGNVMEKIGAKLMPVLGRLLKILGPVIMKVLDALLPVLPKLARAFVKIVVAAMPLIPPLVKLIGLFADIFAKVGPPVITFLVDKLVPAIEAIVKAGRWVFTNWKEIWTGIKDFLADTWRGIQNMFIGVLNFFIDRINTVINWLNKVPGVDVTELQNVAAVADPDAGASAGTTGTTGGRQYGGPVVPGARYWVGEAGPEVLEVEVPGRVIPNSDVRRQGGDRPLVVQVMVDRREIGRAVISSVSDLVARA